MTNILGYPRKSESTNDAVLKAVKAKRGKPDGFVGTDSDGYATLEHLGSGTPSSSTFLRGDGSWQSAGGSGSGNSVTVTVDFGASFSHFATTTVTGQSWVASGSEVVATVLSASGKGMEDAVLSFSASVSSLVAGTGFTLNVFAPYKAKGTYTFSCVGV